MSRTKPPLASDITNFPTWPHFLRLVGMLNSRAAASWAGPTRPRALIAMALLLEPALVIADEPTTALDATTRSQILELLRTLKRETGTSILLITHDFGAVAQIAARVRVMYAGQIVEEASLEQLLNAPQHPYTQGLLNSMLRLGDSRERLPAIPGTVPSALAWPAGCRFHPRCAFAWSRCSSESPAMQNAGEDSQARCHLVSEHERRAVVALS